MFKKTVVKRILNLLYVNSPNTVIAEILHVSRKTIIKVNKVYLNCGRIYEELIEKSDDELYQLFFPNKFQKESKLTPIDFSYVQTELSEWYEKLGGNVIAESILDRIIHIAYPIPSTKTNIREIVDSKKVEELKREIEVK